MKANGSLEDSVLFHSQEIALRAIFGSSAGAYIKIIQSIQRRVFSTNYKFRSDENFKGLSRGELNRLYWTEQLLRAHFVASSSLLRISRWMEAVAVCYSSRNLLGWSACVRSFLEAVGDTTDALLNIPSALAKNNRIIRECLSGKKSDSRVSSQEIEDVLIHFSFARKMLNKVQGIPKSLRAKTTHDYIKNLECSRMPESGKLYAELCEYAHPSFRSVHYSIAKSKDDDGTRIDIRADAQQIEQILKYYRKTFDSCLEVALNPALLTFRVLHKFDVLPKIPELKNVRFKAIPAWAEIESQLRD